MTSRLQKHAPLISWFTRGSPSLCKAIIQEADSDLIKTFCECAHNISQGNLALTPTQKRQLRPHCRKFGVLLDKRVPVGKKKKALQTGGFAVALAKAALPTVLSLLGDSLLKKRSNGPGAFGRARYGF